MCLLLCLYLDSKQRSRKKIAMARTKRTARSSSSYPPPRRSLSVSDALPDGVTDDSSEEGATVVVGVGCSCGEAGVPAAATTPRAGVGGRGASSPAEPEEQRVVWLVPRIGGRLPVERVERKETPPVERAEHKETPPVERAEHKGTGQGKKRKHRHD